MADMPQDPRQLARDILSGKISIEELARRQQQRRNIPPPQSSTNVPPTIRNIGTGPTALPSNSRSQQDPNGGSLPARIPMPRTEAQKNAPPPSQRTYQRPPVQVPRPQQQQSRRSTPPPPTKKSPAPQADSYSAVTQVANQPISESAVNTIVTGTLGASRVWKMLRSKPSLRAGIILSELLGPPVALREDRSRY